MFSKSIPTWALFTGSIVMSVALVTAFSVGDTGARDVSASVVNDSDAFIALEANGDNAYQNFVSTTSGKISVAFDGNNADASGTGINPESTYEFDELINVTNKASESLTVDVTISGTDSALCTVALTSTTGQTSSDYSADPTALSLAKDATGYLGLAVDGTGKVSGDTLSCTISVTA